MYVSAHTSSKQQTSSATPPLVAVDADLNLGPCPHCGETLFAATLATHYAKRVGHHDSELQRGSNDDDNLGTCPRCFETLTAETIAEHHERCIEISDDIFEEISKEIFEQQTRIPVNEDLATQKPGKWLKTAEELTILEDTFRRAEYPARFTIASIAAKFGRRNVRQVEEWFTAKRSRSKKAEVTPIPPTASPLLSLSASPSPPSSAPLPSAPLAASSLLESPQSQSEGARVRWDKTPEELKILESAFAESRNLSAVKLAILAKQLNRHGDEKNIRSWFSYRRATQTKEAVVSTYAAAGLRMTLSDEDKETIRAALSRDGSSSAQTIRSLGRQLKLSPQKIKQFAASAKAVPKAAARCTQNATPSIPPSRGPDTTIFQFQRIPHFLQTNE
ncbi:Nn.00g017650.m01.CDS01 [Neocucurbitaria sp. VM-36]